MLPVIWHRKRFMQNTVFHLHFDPPCSTASVRQLSYLFSMAATNDDENDWTPVGYPTYFGHLEWNRDQGVPVMVPQRLLHASAGRHYRLLSTASAAVRMRTSNRRWRRRQRPPRQNVQRQNAAATVVDCCEVCLVAHARVSRWRFLSPCLAILCQSFNFTILVLSLLPHLINSCPSRPCRCFSPFKFPPNSGKTFEPLESLETRPAHVSFCFTVLFVRCRLSSVIFSRTPSFVTSSFQLTFSIRLQQHCPIASVT